MVPPRLYDYVDTFMNALDSVCISLQLTLDKDDASEEPMVDMVRAEVEEELDRTEALKERVEEERVLGPSSLEEFLRSQRGDIAKALDFYERRLRASASGANSESYDLPLTKTQNELERVAMARLSLTA